jgi:hypothetical protein
MEVLCAHFLLLPSYYYFSPSESPFTFYLCRVFNVHNWALDFIRFFDSLFSLCLPLQTRLGIGCVFFLSRNLRRRWGNGNCVYRVTTWNERFSGSLCLLVIRSVNVDGWSWVSKLFLQMSDNAGWILGSEEDIYTYELCFQTFEQMRFSSACSVECGKARWKWDEPTNKT